ncbi:MAG: lysophospholipid acyltransferase family protein [Acidimicrobiales bacterium]
MAEPRPGDDVEIWTGPPSLATRISYAIVRGFILVVAKLFGRVTVIGEEKIPPTGAYVLAPVHRSNVDFALTAIVTRRPMRYMGKDSIWNSKALGRFVSMLGAFPVHRGSADRDALKACTDIVNGGSPLVMFPEGTRQSGPVVQEMFDGTAYVAAKADVPIIPMGIGGSEAMMPKGAKLLKPSKLVLVVGDPIPPPERTAAGRTPRSAVTALSEQLHGEIQQLFDEAQDLAGRPNPPR